MAVTDFFFSYNGDKVTLVMGETGYGHGVIVHKNNFKDFLTCLDVIEHKFRTIETFLDLV